MISSSSSKSSNSYYIWTIGCQMNKADSERLESAFLQLGLTSTVSPQQADVIVLNSCVVRQSAEDKVVGMLSSLKPLKGKSDEESGSEQRIIALMGCMVGANTDKLQKQFPYVDVFMRPQNYQPLLDVLEERYGLDTEGCLSTLTPPNVGVTAYIPIIHGCDKFCSFCIIPYRRGREVSRPIEDIVREAELLTARGVREITLLGQNVDSYGHDLADSPDLADLLTEVNDIAELTRVRFLTSHPNDMSKRIIESVASLNKVCEHFNLPFQAGNDEVLQVMRRGYTNDDYRRLVEQIRRDVPNVSLGTDLIVGFPGESEEAFQESVDMIRDIEFDKVHVASYSSRPGTIASRKLVDDLPWDEKKHRQQTIELMQEEIQTRNNARLRNVVTEVLVEDYNRGKPGVGQQFDSEHGDGKPLAKGWRGRNRNDKLVFIDDERDLRGQMVRVRINETSPWSLQGVPV